MPLNPFELWSAAQHWFSKTEKSSGFRPYLIFLILFFTFSLSCFTWFKGIPGLTDTIVFLIVISVTLFLLTFLIKCIQDPSFCRSERHIENIRRLELAEQKGDKVPRIINDSIVEIAKPEINKEDAK